MDETDVPNFGWDFLEAIDIWLKESEETVTCADIHKVYFDLFKAQKQWKGNANGFTGMSEYLLFRYLVHRLGGDFEWEDQEVDDTKLDTANFRFRSRANPRIAIGNNLRLKEFGNDRPDIVIWRDEEIRAIVQIKIYISSGIKELRKELRNFERYQERYRGLRGLLVTYSGLSDSRKSKIRPELDQFCEDNDWFDYLVLQGNRLPMVDSIDRQLGLDTIFR